MYIHRRALIRGGVASALAGNLPGAALFASEPPPVASGLWSGGVGEVSDQRLVWDPFFMRLRVQGAQVGGEFTLAGVGSCPIQGQYKKGRLTFVASFGERQLRIVGRVGDDGRLRGSCSDRRRVDPWIAMLEASVPSDTLEACAGIWRDSGGGVILIRHSEHLLLDDFTRGYRRILYARSEDEFASGRLRALTQEFGPTVTFLRDEQGYPTRVVLEDVDGTRVEATRVPVASSESQSLELAGFQVAGTLTLPNRGGRAPAVVWAPALDGVASELAETWSAWFAARGFATFAFAPEPKLPDPVGQSDILRAADQTRAVIRFMRDHPQVDSARVGACASGPGGWAIPAIGAEGGADFAIAFGGAATDMGSTRAFRGWSHRLEASAASLSFEELNRRVGGRRTRGKDFRREYAEMDCPGLWFYGARDRNNPTQRCIDVIQGVAKEFGRDFRVELLPRANHAMLEARFGGERESSALGLRSGAIAETLGAWLETHAG